MPSESCPATSRTDQGGSLNYPRKHSAHANIKYVGSTYSGKKIILKNNIPRANFPSKCGLRGFGFGFALSSLPGNCSAHWFPGPAGAPRGRNPLQGNYLSGRGGFPFPEGQQGICLLLKPKESSEDSDTQSSLKHGGRKEKRSEGSTLSDDHLLWAENSPRSLHA